MNLKQSIISLSAIGIITFAAMAAASDFAGVTPGAVTEDTFIRAEVDARILRFQEEGGMNRGMVYDSPTPTDRQPVPRMNRDTLYMGVPIDTKDGFSVTIPKSPADRYVSVYLLDNDHFTIDILSKPGTHEFGPQDTRYIVAIPRVQVKDAADEADIEIARQILAKMKFDSGSKVPKKVRWDWEQMLEMRAVYEREVRNYSQYPPSFQDTRKSGKVLPEDHRVAVASSWGLFPDYETVYLNDEGPTGPGSVEKCYSATYEVPENEAFWSITMYDHAGYIFSDNATLNASNTKMNSDGTFTAYYGSKKHCGDVANRLDTTEGWAILMRVYRPGESVRAGKYKMPDITEVK
jgi:hypothetical protein